MARMDDEAGHLDCLFDCGLKFSSLEAIYLHIELDHREDNSVSPFAVQSVAENQPYPYGSSDRRPLPALPPSLPPRDVAYIRDSPSSYTPSRAATPESTSGHHAAQSANGYGSAQSGSREADGNDDFVLCPEKACGELILVADLNDHLDFHDAEQASLEDDDSGTINRPTAAASSSLSLPAQSSSDSNGHSHSSRSATPQFSTDIDPSLRSSAGSSRAKMEHDDASRAHIGRKFLSLFGTDRRSKERVPSNKAPLATQRLGTAELGPHAYENQMPGWMFRRLKDGPKITRTRRLARNGGLVTHESIDGQTNGVMPILRQLVELDPAVYKAYLCHPSVTQIGKRSWESGFCGFHNTQMSISYLQNAKHPAHTLFPGYIPGILDIQDWIENAWDEGINDHAKHEFGGLRGTRKWIGTLEVDTLFQYLGIPHRIHQFHDSMETNNQYADQNLLDWVESYFREGVATVHHYPDGRTGKVRCTLKPPIYFQRPGHSLTIVGVERMRNGSRNLLVFDPMYQVPTSMLQLIERGRVKDTNSKLLKFYRRSQNRLYHYADFEATTFEGELPMFPAWDVLLDHDKDVFVTITDWQWEMWPCNSFSSCFPWPFFGSIFRTKEARFERVHCSMEQAILPGGWCLPQVWLREGQEDVPLYEKWLLPEKGQDCLSDG